jgi:hypothetical protein
MMGGGERRPLRVLLFSSGNPAATFLAAGLLGGRPDAVGTILIQGIGDATPAAEVAIALAEVGIGAGYRSAQIVDAPPAEAVDAGLTICVPVCAWCGVSTIRPWLRWAMRRTWPPIAASATRSRR